METVLPKMTQAQWLDAVFFNWLWQTLFDQGQIDLAAPPDAEMWRRDLGRSLQVTFAWLGDLAGKRVLELGGGPGDYTMMLARRGAQVTAIDIAPAGLQITRRRARRNRVNGAVTTCWTTAETLPFPAETFDWVVGFGLLHHADPVTLGPEVRRVLRPGGRAIFREPLGTNPVLQFARNHVPYRRKYRSLNEHPLHYGDIYNVGQHFRAVRTREFYLFSMISRAVGGEMSFPYLWAVDEFLIKKLPLVRPWCRYILVEYAA